MAGCLRNPVVYIISSLGELSSAVKKCLPNANITNISLLNTGEISHQDEAAVLNTAEVLFADLPFIAKYIYKADKLKWAHSTWAGVETIMRQVDKEKPPNVLLSRPGTAFGDLMAEYILAHIMAREKNIYGAYTNHYNKVWSQSEFRQVRLISSLKLGILGAGQIGTKIGCLCKAVGMEVWGMTRESRTDTSKLPLDVYKTCDELPEILQNCDYICNVLPSTENTRNVLSGDMLKHCQNKKSILINVGRGDVIDEDSLVNAIRNGWIGGAILDVFKTEPLPQESVLWTLPNVIITSHISGPSQAQFVLQSFVENYTKFIRDEKLNYIVDWDRGY